MKGYQMAHRLEQRVLEPNPENGLKSMKFKYKESEPKNLAG